MNHKSERPTRVSHVGWSILSRSFCIQENVLICVCIEGEREKFRKEHAFDHKEILVKKERL